MAQNSTYFKTCPILSGFELKIKNFNTHCILQVKKKQQQQKRTFTIFKFLIFSVTLRVFMEQEECLDIFATNFRK